MGKDFLHCFRVQIVPNHYEEERLSSIVEFCVKHKFDNVMLFINAETYNQGHMTKEEAKPWVEAIKRAKKALNEKGISVSLNPWIEIGHLDRGRKLKEGQNFVTMEDYDGNKSPLVACPMDENWRSYFTDFYKYLLEEVEPCVMWVEDDFRLHNHAPLKYGGCFCPLHMNAFNAKLGTKYTREEFTDLLFRKTPDENVKRAFLDVNRECMNDLAKVLGDTVKKYSPKTEVGLMSSAHIRHAMEGRDWHTVHKNLASGGEMINRLHLPMYMETSIKSYYLVFNAFTFVCRGLLPDECRIYPELEISSFNVFSKDKECVRFQVESSLPLELAGMTYDIFDYTGNGALPSYGYGEAVNKIDAYLNSVMNSGYKYGNLSGMVLPIDEKTAYNRKIEAGDFMSLSPDMPYPWARLQAYGVAAKTSTEKHFKEQTVALYGDIVNNFTDSELKDLFANNRAVLEGTAVMALVERGLGSLVGIKSYKADHNEARSYEQVSEGIIIEGIKGFRCTAHGRAGVYLNIEYDGAPDVKSRVYDYTGCEVGLGNVVSNGHFIFPYYSPDSWDILYDQFNPLRRELFVNYLLENDGKAIVSNYPGIYTYSSEVANKSVLILVNTTLSGFENTQFHSAREIEEIIEICRDGVERKVSFTKSGALVSVDSAIESVSTKTFKLVFKK